MKKTLALVYYLLEYTMCVCVSSMCPRVSVGHQHSLLSSFFPFFCECEQAHFHRPF